MRPIMMFAALGGAFAASAAYAEPIPKGAAYVAMGSSFAAGPGITRTIDARCRRSADNYAQQLARRRGLALTDVSCSGAATAHVLGPWNELPAQMDALTAETRLVTLTIGGNDLGYSGGLNQASCRYLAAQGRPLAQPCQPRAVPGETAYADDEAAIRRIVREVHRRAPKARIVVVDYLTVLPKSGACARSALSPEDANASRVIARRLAELTARAAKAEGAEVLKASDLSAAHDECAAEPWTHGFLDDAGKPAPATHHPNLAGMTAVADALDKLLAD